MPLLAALAAASAPAAPVALDFDLHLDPAARRLSARGTLVVRAAAGASLVLGRQFRLKGILDGRPLAAPQVGQDGQVWTLPACAPCRLSVEWSGDLAPPPDSASQRETLGELPAMADPQGGFLPAGSLWYPSVFAGKEVLLASHRISVRVPPGQRALVAGDTRSEREDAHGYTATYEQDAGGELFDLVAGPYKVRQRDIDAAGGRKLRIATWFHADIDELSDGYLDAVQTYLARYEALIGPYPGDAFRIVSSPLPTGFGMPGYTYLGVRVLRLPFIKSTSLGHEVLHNWWGNGVYPDYARGNWSEGLTTFMADYAYKEDAGEEAARAMRLAWLRDLAAVPAGDAFPLTQFTARSHGASQIIGYHKAALVFFMLRDILGRDVFERGLRRFWQQKQHQVAGWDDLRAAWQQESRRDLQPWFKQWLTRADLPRLRLAGARPLREGARHALEIDLEQQAPAYVLDVPLAVTTAAGSLRTTLRIDAPRARLRLDLPAAAQEVTLDPDFRLARALVRGEAPPILRQVLIDAATQVVTLGDAPTQAAATRLARALLDPAPHAQAGAAASGRPRLVIGSTTVVESWLATQKLPPRPTQVAGGDMAAWALQTGDGGGLAVVAARDAAALDAALRALPHYGAQSWVVMEGGRVKTRGNWEGRPQSLRVPAE
ncbi:MAG: M1 family peptidase [Rhodocyclaceae bacterium]|nr:M1 family peptidase [Rhodocyclaceae bacterium]MBX3668240.1 M1 family peptidase [Rhodocyclaceae bacterium]